MKNNAISGQDARRLFITKQRLSGKRPAPTKDSLLAMTRDLNCIQIDPISAVSPSHYLVMWSRIGKYDKSLFDELMYRDRKLFEYWAHELSIVLMDDYSLFYSYMQNYPPKEKMWAPRVAKWLRDNRKLEQYILSELKSKGPLSTREFEDKSERQWSSSGWSNDRNVTRMLQFLFTRGKVMVSGREGNVKLWDLSEKCLPNGFQKKILSEEEIDYIAVQRAIKSLGAAPIRHIRKHFLRDSYQDLEKTLKQLESDSKILKLTFENLPEKDPWYIHRDDEPLLEEIRSGRFDPRTTLLSPFDNLICDRIRTRQLLNFDYTIEIYVPAPKRKFGYYVLPILSGDRLVGRVDSAFIKDKKEFAIREIFAESKAKIDHDGLKESIKDLAAFLGAETISIGELPRSWKLAGLSR